MGWLEDSGSGLRGAAAREARKERLKERQSQADVQVEKIDGAAAREARKRKLQEKQEEEGLSGAALRQKRKERQAAKEEEEKRLKEEAEKKKHARLSRTQGKDACQDQDNGNTGEANQEDEEARQKRLAEKIAARRAALQQNAVVEDENDEEEAAGESSEDEPASQKGKPSDDKKKDGSSSSSEAKKKKKEKKKKKKKKKSSSSSVSSSSGISEEAKRMAKIMAMQSAGSFAWERKPDDVPTITDFSVLASAATPQEVEDFLKQSCLLDPSVCQRLRNLAPPIQKMVIDRGPINNSQAPSHVLGARIRDAEMGKFGLPGQGPPPENPKIEALIKKYANLNRALDINCIHRLRHESLAVQKAIVAIDKDIEECSNPSGLIMARLNEFSPVDTSQGPNHTGMQLVFR